MIDSGCAMVRFLDSRPQQSVELTQVRSSQEFSYRGPSVEVSTANIMEVNRSENVANVASKQNTDT